MSSREERLARLEERSRHTVASLQSIERKVDAINEKLWGLKVKLASFSALVSAGVIAAAKALGI